jgi:hypothetical protein
VQSGQENSVLGHPIRPTHPTCAHPTGKQSPSVQRTLQPVLNMKTAAARVTVCVCVCVCVCDFSFPENGTANVVQKILGKNLNTPFITCRECIMLGISTY